MKEDFEWFKAHYDELFQKYGTTHIVIKNKKVIGTYPSFSEAVRETSKTEEPGTFSVQYCDGTPEAYTVRILSTTPVVSVAGG